MTTTLRRLAAITAVALLSGAPSFAQGDEEAAVQEAAVRAEAAHNGDDAENDDQENTLQPPADLAAAVEMSKDLPKAAEGLDAVAATALLGAYLGLIDEQSASLRAVLDAETGTPQRLREAAVRADLGTLFSTTEGLIEAFALRGFDVTSARVAVVTARDAATPMDDSGPTEMTRNAAINVDLEVLRATLRPMTMGEVEGRLVMWLALLQQVCIEVRDLEIATLTSSDTDDEVSLSERAVLLRGERSHLINRVNAVIEAIEVKGGDASEARAYVESVIAIPPITGFRAALMTAWTWLRSPGGGIAVGLNLARALAILLISFGVSRILARIASKGMKRAHGTSSLLKGFVVTMIKRGTVAIGALIALTTLGVNMAPLLAAIGAAGLVVGLALQGTLGNLASGLMIMVYRPFDVQDVVDVAGVSGKVVGMNLMTTEVRTFDNRTVYVPNSRIWGDVITNVTANSTRRVDMVFGIGYGDDSTKARTIIEGILETNEKVLADPEFVVRMHELADSSVNFIVRPWSKTADYWDVYWEVTEAVKAEFDAQNISIPFPQSDIHVIHEGAAGNSGAGSHVIVPHEPERESSTSESQQEVAADS